MSRSVPGRGTGDPEIDRRLVEVLEATGARANADQLSDILATVAQLAQDGTDRLNLKITNAALAEMRRAFKVFAPYRDVPKITVFGSARTLPADPLYAQTRDLAAALAQAGWMVVTGAGPGIMAAAVEGAGVGRSIGVTIRLPDPESNPQLASDPNLVEMKYFFTRKLMLMKESAGFAVLPGGFGTLDEAFELLTLLQTGKAEPAPIVLVDTPGGTYWHGWERFIRGEVLGPGLVSGSDLGLYRITDDVHDAVAEILGFYRNYHSIRYVGDRLVVRIRARPTQDELEKLNEAFADICERGRIELGGPLPAEVGENDHPDLPRLLVWYRPGHHRRLRALVDALNGLASAPDDDVVQPPLSSRSPQKGSAQEGSTQKGSA